MDSWNLDSQNTQNASNPIEYHYAFGHYPLGPILSTSQLSSSPYGKHYKANPEARISPLLQTLFSISTTTPSSFPPTSLFFYLATLVSITPTAAPTAVPNRVFAKALIATPPLPTVFIIALVALAAPAHQLAITSTSNNGHGSIKERRKLGETTRDSNRRRKSHEETPMPQSHGVRISSPRSLLSPSLDWLTPALPSDAESSKEERPKKKLGIGI